MDAKHTRRGVGWAMMTQYRSGRERGDFYPTVWHTHATPRDERVCMGFTQTEGGGFNCVARPVGRSTDLLGGRRACSRKKEK